MLFNFTDPIEKADFSFRVCNGFRTVGICTLGDLLTFDCEKLPEITKIPKTSYRYIYNFLNPSNNKDWYNFHLIYKKKAEISTALIREPDGKLRKDVPLKKLDLSPKTQIKLEINGYEFISQLIGISLETLLLIMGKKSANEAIQATKSFAFEYVPSSFLTTNADFLCSEFVDEISKVININSKQLHRELLPFFKSATDAKKDINLSDLFSLPLLRDAVKQKIILLSSIYSLKRDSLEIKTQFPENMIECEIIADILKELETDKKIKILENISIIEYVQNFFSGRDQKILLMRLQGCTLSEIGLQIGVTKERVRQIINSRLKHKPIVSENDFIEVFEKYKFSKHDFCFIFEKEEYVYHYLMMVSEKPGVIPIEHLIDDESYTDEIRLNTSEIINNVNEKFYDTRLKLVNYVLQTYFQDEGLFVDFVDQYNKVLESFELTTVSRFKLSPHYATSLCHSNKVLWKYGRKLRYYDINSYEFTEFWQQIRLEQYHNVAFTAHELFEDNLEVMHQYDIRDGYELHNLLRKLCRKKAVPNLSFGKFSIIKFG